MKKTRKDSFLGIHLDYHAKPEDGKVQGKDLKEEDIRKICKVLKPDFIQIDCKGHPGWASYPTKVGNAMPEFEKDTLALWRRVTEEEGVALYMHYSGVYDRKYCRENPDEAVMTEDGNIHDGATRLDGKYVDDVLIPQLLELAEVYKVDGVWVDGDCWMALTDFRPETMEKFQKETGIDLNGRAPKTPSDPYYQEYREYHRELFRRYLNHYVDTLHEAHPDFQIASNWAFSDHMPEKVCANVDFLSGDLNPMNSFNSARYAARALAQQEYSWDLMSWNFRNSLCGRRGYVAKHPCQIMQEAAPVLAVGGAFQNYIPQRRDGSPNMPELENLEGVYDFLRERKDFCFRGKPVHQAALLLSTYDRRMEAKPVYSRNGYDKVMGLTALLCDVGQSLEIVCEHTLEKNIDKYEMIVIPELFSGLENETVSMLYEYAKNGGKLLITGRNTCNLFASYKEAPFSVKNKEKYVDRPEEQTQNGHDGESGGELMPYFFTMDGKEFGGMYAPCEVIAEGRTDAYGSIRNENESFELVKTVSYGKGSITVLGFEIGAEYLYSQQYLHRRLIKSIADRLYTPIVKIESVCGRLEVVALEKDGKLMVQLVNGNGTHMDRYCSTDDCIPPVLDIRISVKSDTSPAKMILQPEGKELHFEYKDGRAYVSVPRVDIHNVIEVVM